MNGQHPKVKRDARRDPRPATRPEVRGGLRGRDRPPSPLNIALLFSELFVPRAASKERHWTKQQQKKRKLTDGAFVRNPRLATDMTSGVTRKGCACGWELSAEAHCCVGG